MQPVLAIGLLLSAAQLATGFGVGSPAWIRGPGMYSLARSVEMYESGRVANGFGTCHLVPAPTAMAYNNFGAVGSVQQQRMGLAQEFGGRIVLVKDEQGWRDVRSAAAQTGAILCAEFRAQYCRKVSVCCLCALNEV